MSCDTQGADSDIVWVKSSHSSNEGGECVEVARTSVSVFVRDSKNPDGPRLQVPDGGWAALLQRCGQA
ncbi:DUF397 domain-containing protein [Yinghuangia soli]|uniref:DUF397 domain-containing protein n=1 Tax=Yinghuangia soli TaxID=2908204 RepID=A0AA41TZY9_9ACTN|nr:DUF397 domain-containing protein [Yinghuangia soli]MCF2525872.1 DUF397 domain-containing protein [Yinghuangia soli]